MMRPLRKAAPLAAALIATACAVPMLGEDEDEDGTPRAVSGELQTLEQARLPPESELVVSFRGLDGEVLAEERSRIDRRAPPYAFDLVVPADRIGTLAGLVEAEAEPRWRSVSVLIEPGPEPVDLGRLILAPVETGFAPAAGQAEAALPPGPVEAAGTARATREAAETPQTAGEPQAGEQAVAAAAGTGPIRLDCGDSEISVDATGGAADVTVGETVVEMAAVEAGGGGRRYAVPDDPATYLALEGDAAEVSFAGVVLSDCAVAARGE